MRHAAAVLAVLLAAPAAALAPAALAQAPSEATVEKHVAEATRLAGPDLKPLLALCKPAPAQRPPQADTDHYIATQIARPAPEPGQAFDNLYFIGGAWASAWAITTSEGIILIDALNNEAEAAALIEGGMKKLGLDPAQIKYIVVTHAHGDHYGGAPYLAGKYKARVVMSEADWRQTETKLEFNSPHWGPVPKRDISVVDGERLRLGDTTITLNITPGHTLGTLTPVFEVRSGGKVHRALLWGGTAFNFGKDVPRLDMYIAATQRMAKQAHVLPVDVMLSNHPGYDGTVSKLETRRKDPASNPFVIGTEAVERGLLAMGECAMAQRDRFLLDK